MSRERGNQMAKKNEEVNEETLDKETEKTAEPKEEEKSNEEVLEEKLKEQTDKYMRLYAEYDNYQKRSQREKDMRYGDAVIDTVGAILSIGDNLELPSVFLPCRTQISFWSWTADALSSRAITTNWWR